MKQIAVSIVFAGAAVTLSAQQATFSPLTEEQRAAIEAAQMSGGGGGRARVAVETRVTQGAPYSAEAVTEFSQVLPDGNRITRRSVTRTFRDSDGRTRREQTTVTAAGESVSITIVDPVARTSFLLDPQNRVAVVSRPVMAVPASGFGTGTGTGTGTGAGAGTGVGAGGRGGGRGGAIGPAPATVAPARVPEGSTEVRRRQEVELAETSREAAGQLKVAQERAASGSGTTTKESLGQQMMEGVMAEGTRTTTVIPAGAIGNLQAITVVSEQWFSPDLQVLVMTRHSDPRSGESTYRLTNLVRGEPDRSLFEVPADYTIKQSGGFIKQQSPQPPGDAR